MAARVANFRVIFTGQPPRNVSPMRRPAMKVKSLGSFLDGAVLRKVVVVVDRVVNLVV
jgi:hypothetical protein